jgi:uncharacterized protein YecE (DUF72 family)
MKKNIQIGCSSYNNRYWKGVFYPQDLPTSKWFDYYCRHFDTYEMNGTFYKFPTLRIFENWYKKVPEHFLFSVKAPKDITHFKKFIGCEALLSEFYDLCATGLKEKLGPILFQLPPSYSFTSERLQDVINSLDKKFLNVVEFRHQSLECAFAKQHYILQCQLSWFTRGYSHTISSNLYSFARKQKAFLFRLFKRRFRKDKNDNFRFFQTGFYLF